MKVNRPNVSTPPPPTSMPRSAPTTPSAPSSPVQRTSAPTATSPTSTPRGTDALDPSTLRPSARAGATSGASIPTPPPPPPPRAPVTTPGQPPQSVNSSLEAELARGRASLNKTDHGVVHPDLQGIRTRRDNQAPHEFADFTRDTRASTHRLMEGQTGQAMLTDVNNSTDRLHPGATGTQKAPLTAVDIHQGTSMTHAPRTKIDEARLAQELSKLPPGDVAAKNQLIEKFQGEMLASTQGAYRNGGQPGTGAASQIKYNPNGQKVGDKDTATMPGDHRANSLGHEMTHAWRASNGVQVGTLETAKLNHHPVFEDANKAQPGGGKELKHNVNFHAQLKEEFETVGIQQTPGRPNAPSENKIRQELGMNQRQDYSGYKPADTAAALQDMKQQPDTRTAWGRLSGKPIPGAEQRASDVQQLVDHLEK